MYRHLAYMQDMYSAEALYKSILHEFSKYIVSCVQ